MQFPVKVRAALAPWSLQSETFLPFLIHTHPKTSDTLPKMETSLFSPSSLLYSENICGAAVLEAID